MIVVLSLSGCVTKRNYVGIISGLDDYARVVNCAQDREKLEIFLKQREVVLKQLYIGAPLRRVQKSLLKLYFAAQDASLSCPRRRLLY